MERVGHDHSVQVLQVQRVGEVRHADIESALNALERARVIYGSDVGFGAEQVGERQRECTFARAEVGPTASPLPNPFLNQRD